jgi:hypothetical protein
MSENTYRPMQRIQEKVGRSVSARWPSRHAGKSAHVLVGQEGENPRGEFRYSTRNTTLSLQRAESAVATSPWQPNFSTQSERTHLTALAATVKPDFEVVVIVMMSVHLNNFKLTVKCGLPTLVTVELPVTALFIDCDLFCVRRAAP